MPVVRDLSQAQIAFNLAGGDVERFQVVRYRGSEGLCQLYRFELELASTDLNVGFKDMVGKAAVLSINTSTGERWFHGIISRFELVNQTQDQALYRAELVPAVWLLTHRYNSRIYQNKTVKDIITDVLTLAGFPNDRFKFNLKANYSPREYCVQYRETDYNFIARLMEEEGIWWCFEQTKDKHVLVMADSKEAYAPIDGELEVPFVGVSGMTNEEDHVFRFRLGQAMRPGAVTLTDFNFEDPSLSLESSAGGQQDASLEFFDYPGEYGTQSDGQNYAGLRMEEFEGSRTLGVGQSTSRRFAPGRKFKLSGHPIDALNGTYLLTAVTHQGKQATRRATTGETGRTSIIDARTHQSLLAARGSENPTIRELAEAVLQIAARLRLGDATAHHALTQWVYHAGQVSRDLASVAAASGSSPLEAVSLRNLVEDIAQTSIVDFDMPPYECRFECIPAEVVFRPARVTPWPVMRGSQTARVVGKPGEEIDVDQYGRVKVQFNWDREGKFDDKSSCWIRVAQGMAGGGYGMLFLPRVGQEVIVDFLEGDPDRPIIIGRVFNADHMPPYKLPDEKTKSVIKTHSSKGGGGCNEIRFEDLKGKEQLFIQAQRRMDTRVKAGHFHTVGGYHLIVGGEDQSGNLHGAYLQLVYKEKRTHVKDFREMWIEGDEQYFIGGMQYVDIGGDHLQVVQGNVRVESRGRSIQASTYSVGADTIKLDATTGIELVCGGSSIVLTPGAIFINGPVVNINSGSGPSQPAAPNVATPPTSEAEPGAADSSKPGKDTTYKGGKKLPAGTVEADVPGTEWPDEGPEPRKANLAFRLIKAKKNKDDPDEPVANEDCTITKPDGSTQALKTDGNGEVKLEGVEPGTYLIQFPNREDAEWEFLRIEAMTPAPGAPQ